MSLPWTVCITDEGERILELRGLGMSCIPELTPGFRFSGLDLCSNELRDITALPRLPDLQHLYLANNRISRVSGLHRLFPRLEALNLRGNLVSDLEDVILCVKQLPNLWFLDLTGNPVLIDSDVENKLFMGLAQCSRAIRIINGCRVKLSDRPAHHPH